MYSELSYEAVRERSARQRQQVEKQRLGVLARRARRKESREALRARAARRLFAAAFALDARESWRAVWDRMSAPDDPGAEAGEGELR